MTSKMLYAGLHRSVYLAANSRGPKVVELLRDWRCLQNEDGHSVENTLGTTNFFIFFFAQNIILFWRPRRWSLFFLIKL